MAAYTTLGVFFCLILVLLKDYTVTCDQIRLVGGSKPYKGRLQIKKPNDRWREMCYVGFRNQETRVACNQIRNDIDDSPLAHDFREVDRLDSYRIDEDCLGIEERFRSSAFCTFSKVSCTTDDTDLCCQEGNAIHIECLRKAYDCGSNNPCYPSLATPGVRAYNHIDKNQIVQCRPDQKGTHTCITSKCPTSTEYDHIAKRCFSYEEFDCGSRDPCHLVAQTSQTIYRRVEVYNKHYVECVYQKDWTTKCVHKTCSFGIVDVATQACV